MNRGEYLWHCNGKLVVMGWLDKHPVYPVYNHPPPPNPFTRCTHNHSKKGRTWAKTASSMPILICYVMILFSSLVFISFLSRHLINSQTREDASISNHFLIDTSCESCRLSFMSFELGFRDRE